MLRETVPRGFEKGVAAEDPRHTRRGGDHHNTSNALLLLCADALIAPVLHAGLTDLDELKVALGCRFALITTIQQDNPVAHQEPVICDPASAAWCWLPTQCSARVDVHALRPGSLAGRDTREAYADLTSPQLRCLGRVPPARLF